MDFASPDVTSERLREWREACYEDRTIPLIIVAMGTGLDAGNVHVYAARGDLTQRDLVKLLRGVVRQLER